MNQNSRQGLSHVLWLGGATDAGKTTVAALLARKHGLQVYHYDRHDLPHHEQLAQTSARYRRFLDASDEERWVIPEAEELRQRTLRSFHDRFPLVVKNLLALPTESPVIAEGFGLTPVLAKPFLSNLCQAIWFVPTEAFKWASMRGRGKFARRFEMSDPQRVVDNLFRRDMMLAQRIVEQARAQGLRVVEVDGSRTPEELSVLVEEHFSPYLQLLALS